MARKVKCQDTGEYSTNDIAFKGADGKYYSSETAYLNFRAEKEDQKKCVEIFFNATDWNSALGNPGVFVRTMAEWSTNYKYKTILHAMQESENDIRWAVQHKTFTSAYNLQRYVAGIVANNLFRSAETIRDYERKEQKMQNVINSEASTSEYSLLKVNRKSTDVSSLLGDV